MSDKKLYFIYAREHKAFWGPNSNGYTRNLGEAGVYSFEEATRICEKANFHLKPEDPREETMIEY